MNNYHRFGFSLVEVLVSAALIGGIALALTQVMTDSTKGTKYSFQQTEIEQVTVNIQRILKTRTSCSETLKGLRDGDNLGIITTLPLGSITPQETEFKIGASFGQAASTVSIKEMKLAKNSNDTTDIEITFVRTRDTSDEGIENAKKRNVGAVEVKKTITVNTIYENGEIVDCKTENEENIIGFCTNIDGEPEGTPASTKCRAINLFKHPDRAEPAITAVGDVFVQGGLATGDLFTEEEEYNPDIPTPTDQSPLPSNSEGNVHLDGDLALNQEFIFNHDDNNIDNTTEPRITLEDNNQRLIFKEKKSNDLKLGKETPFLYRDHARGFGINKENPKTNYILDVSGAVKVGGKIEIEDNVSIEVDPSSKKLIIKLATSNQSVEIIGEKNAEYNPADNSTTSKNTMATREWVLEALGAILAADQATLDKIANAALESTEGTSDIDIRKGACDDSDNLRWENNRCEIAFKDFECTDSSVSGTTPQRKYIDRIDFKNKNGYCETITHASIGSVYQVHDNDNHNPDYAPIDHDNIWHNPDYEPVHDHPYAPLSHGNEAHGIQYAPYFHRH